MIRYDPHKQLLRLGVGDLVHYGEEPALRHVPAMATRLAAGSREHGQWRSEAMAETESTDFLAEVSLVYETSLKGNRVVVEGRVDGLRREGERLVVEEVKTVLRPPEDWDARELEESVLAGTAFRAYRLQLEIYLLMVEANPPLDLFSDGDKTTTIREAPGGRLIFRNLACDESQERETVVSLQPDFDEIRKRAHQRLETILDDLLTREGRRERAAEFASALPFPFPSYRVHQHEISETVAESLGNGKKLLLSAPPGFGKTAAVLHAALRVALPRGLKVFWLTAKTTQQRLVVETLRLILDRLEESSPAKPPLRAVVLRAREKMCPNLAEGGRVFCHDSYCRYARDHWRKVRQHHILDDLIELPIIEPETVYERSAKAVACPYEVTMSAAAEADLIIGDYNYIFDPSSSLRRLDLDRLAGQAILVVDEAHNLLSRGRESHSPSIDTRALEKLLECASAEAASGAKSIFMATKHFLERLQELEEEANGPPDAEAVRVEIDESFIEEFAADVERFRGRRLVEKREAPVILPDAIDDALETCTHELRRFLGTLDLEDDKMRLAPILESRKRSKRLRLLCLDPSSLLGRRLQSFHSVIAMSATLAPSEFFRDMLGFPAEDTGILEYPSPFPRQNRAVIVDPGFATTYRRRSGEARRIAETVDAIAREHPGNYLVFLSSHRYQSEVTRHIDATRIGKDVLLQKRFMSEEERDEYLALLREPDSRRILYAVQGGIFGEGVDYAGGMASGVVIVGPGLPRFDHEQELIREHFDYLYQKGFEYAYLYPGMHRVIQAAGRLIRSPDDVGVVVLLGERFADSRFTRLFPEDWYESSPRELVTNDLLGDVREFWKKHH